MFPPSPPGAHHVTNGAQSIRSRSLKPYIPVLNVDCRRARERRPREKGAVESRRLAGAGVTMAVPANMARTATLIYIARLVDRGLRSYKITVLQGPSCAGGRGGFVLETTK